MRWFVERPSVASEDPQPRAAADWSPVLRCIYGREALDPATVLRLAAHDEATGEPPPPALRCGRVGCPACRRAKARAVVDRYPDPEGLHTYLVTLTPPTRLRTREDAREWYARVRGCLALLVRHDDREPWAEAAVYVVEATARHDEPTGVRCPARAGGGAAAEVCRAGSCALCAGSGALSAAHLHVHVVLTRRDPLWVGKGRAPEWLGPRAGWPGRLTADEFWPAVGVDVQHVRGAVGTVRAYVSKVLGYASKAGAHEAAGLVAAWLPGVTTLGILGRAKAPRVVPLRERANASDVPVTVDEARVVSGSLDRWARFRDLVFRSRNDPTVSTRRLRIADALRGAFGWAPDVPHEVALRTVDAADLLASSTLWFERRTAVDGELRETVWVGTSCVGDATDPDVLRAAFGVLAVRIPRKPHRRTFVDVAAFGMLADLCAGGGVSWEALRKLGRNYLADQLDATRVRALQRIEAARGYP